MPKCLIELEYWRSLSVKSTSVFADKLTEVPFWNVCNICKKELQSACKTASELKFNMSLELKMGYPLVPHKKCSPCLDFQGPCKDY